MTDDLHAHIVDVLTGCGYASETPEYVADVLIRELGMHFEESRTDNCGTWNRYSTDWIPADDQ